MEVEALFREIVVRVDSLELTGAPEWENTNHSGGWKHIPILFAMVPHT